MLLAALDELLDVELAVEVGVEGAEGLTIVCEFLLDSLVDAF